MAKTTYCVSNGHMELTSLAVITVTGGHNLYKLVGQRGKGIDKKYQFNGAHKPARFLQRIFETLPTGYRLKYFLDISQCGGYDTSEFTLYKPSIMTQGSQKNKVVLQPVMTLDTATEVVWPESKKGDLYGKDEKADQFRNSLKGKICKELLLKLAEYVLKNNRSAFSPEENESLEEDFKLIKN